MDKVIDDEQIAMLVEGAGIEAVRPILDAYWQSNAQLTAALKNGIASADTQEIAATAHGLKGSSANLGALKVAERARAIEQAAKAGDFAAVEAAFEALAADFEETRDAFEEVLKDAA
jgi:HPt (histidine-containing phosphotransfer) domain-containing protein